MTPHDSTLYGGIADVSVPSESFDLGSGVSIAPTEAHLMRPCLMTYRRPETSFPAMKSAHGSFGFDIVAEIFVPKDFNPPSWFDRPNTIWWVAALLRLRATPRVRVPVISNVSFARGLSEPDSRFWPVESEFELGRMVLEPNASDSVEPPHLEWIRTHWIDAAHLMNTSREFNLALQAFDQSSFVRDPMLALLLLWGVLEGLFSPGQLELRFRVSANIATFLERRGPERALLQTRTAKLYDARSAAAHGRPKRAEKALIETYSLLKRVLLEIIELNHVPTIAELEASLFGD